MNNGPNLSALARDMLRWEQKKRELDELEQAIKDTIMQIGETYTVGYVRATYSAGRKKYDYAGAVVQAGLTEDHKLIGMYSKLVTDWRAICQIKLIADIPFTQSPPSVSVKLLN